MGKEKCAICKASIPNKTQDELINLGYTGTCCYDKKLYIFCPKHKDKEILDFIKDLCKKSQKRLKWFWCGYYSEEVNNKRCEKCDMRVMDKQNKCHYSMFLRYGTEK